MASVAARLASQAKPEPVSQGISLTYYYRSAHNVRRMAENSLLEGHVLQGYVYLLRFTSLMLETIPRHKEYNKEDREWVELSEHTKTAICKLETLRVQIDKDAAHSSPSSTLRSVDDVSGLFPLTSRRTEPGLVPLAQTPWSEVSGESGTAPSAPPAWPDASMPAPPAAPLDLDLLTGMLAAVPSSSTAPHPPALGEGGRRAQEMFLATPGEDKSLPRSRPRPSSQVLDRHMLMPSLSGPPARQVVARPPTVTPPAAAAKVLQYPNFIDDAPATIPEFRDLEEPKVCDHSAVAANSATAPTMDLLSNGVELPAYLPGPGSNGVSSASAGTLAPSGVPTVTVPVAPPPAYGTLNAQQQWPPAAHPQVVRPLQPPGGLAGPITPLIRQPSIPPVEVPVTTVAPPPHGPRLDLGEQLPPPPPWEVADPRPGVPAPSSKQQKNMLMSLHLSARMLDEFMRLARDNTLRNLETCAVLAGTMKNEKFSIHTLIIPKQQSTSDSCTTVNEEEIFHAQDERDLFSLGWIHTHPTQTCFMSSIDLHTHCAYQTMLSEAVAIVMAPSDTNRRFGIFRLGTPGGLKLIQQCNQRGFHPHGAPPGGGRIYEHCEHVFLDQRVPVNILDLR